MKNAFTIDVEDWFQGIELKQDQWKGKEYRLEKGLDVVLGLLSDKNVHGTFFTLGWIAQHYPDVIKKISSAGHELASHGYSHEKVYDLSPVQFREEVRITKQLVENITGRKITGYRAPFFSVTSASLWSLPILQEEGYTYDCSINPVKTWRYGISSSPDCIYRISEVNLTEFPVSTFKFLGKRLAIGGAYVRIFPLALTESGIRKKNNNGEPVNFYAHPWEYDPYHPVEKNIEFKARTTHYFNLKSMKARTEKLLSHFEFDTAERVIAKQSERKPLPEISLDTLRKG